MKGELVPIPGGDRKLYDVDPKWSEERKEAFALYRDMGTERSLLAVSQKLQKSEGLINRWSRLDGWRIRVSAFDAEQDKIKLEAAREELIKITKAHS